MPTDNPNPQKPSKIGNIFYTILVFLSAPFLFVILLPVYIFRLIISICVPLFSKHLTKLVSLHSATYLDANQALSSTFNIIISATLNSPIDFKRFTQRVANRVVFVKNAEGKLSNPELQQYFTTFMGYHFWTKCESFQIIDYVKRHIVENAFEFETEWIQIPIEYGKSPWEVVVLQPSNLKPVILVKFHHALADGHSMFNLLCQLADYDVQRYESKGFDLPLPARCLMPFRGVYKMVKMARESPALTPPWVISSKKSNQIARPLFGISKVISKNKIKEFSKQRSVSALATYFTVMSAGFRKFLLTKVPEDQLPEYVTPVTPYPKHMHPNRLVNHFNFVTVKLPMKLPNFEDLLSFCSNFTRNEVFAAASAATVKLTLTKLLAALPFKMRVGTAQFIPPICMFMFLGPLKLFSIDNNQVQCLHFLADVDAVNFISMMFCLLTYDERIVFTVTVDSDPTIFPNQKSVQQLIQTIEDQMDGLVNF